MVVQEVEYGYGGRGEELADGEKEGGGRKEDDLS